MTRTKVAPASPKLVAANERYEKSLADFERHYKRLMRAARAMEKCRRLSARLRKLIATLKDE